MRSSYVFKMKLNKLLLWCISVVYSCYGVFSFNILAVLPYHGKSHFFVFEPYLKELARRGHNLTVISYFPQEKPIPNYHDISLAGKVKILEGVFPVHRSYWSIVQLFLFLYNMGRNNCEDLLANTMVQNLWKSETKFDLVVTEQFNSDCSLGLAYKLGAPVVGMTSHTLMPWHYERLGIEYNPSYISFPFLEGGTAPTLYQRLERLVFHHFSNTIYKYACQRMNENQLQQYFDIPPLEELVRDMKLMLLYTHFSLNGPTLISTNIVEVGGYHVAKPKKLPQDLKKFIEESHHGVIYISFGSMLRATSLPSNKLEAIVKVISELPQRVIWKWDEKVLPGNPKNVYLAKWLPQNDILAHPKILAFYSHCGMLSTSEAIYHGVPMIAMPVFGDQPGNAAAVDESGLGVQIQIGDLTKEILSQKFETVLNPEFRRKVKELSKIWHDRPVSAMNSAIYWTEFAARTKNFTFKNPASAVPLYQYIYLDIITAVVVAFLAATFVLKFLLSLSKKPHSKLIKPKTK